MSPGDSTSPVKVLGEEYRIPRYNIPFLYQMENIRKNVYSSLLQISCRGLLLHGVQYIGFLGHTSQLNFDRKPCSTMTTMATLLNEAQDVIGHRFENTQVLREALSAAGSPSHAPDGNKRLAMLGDSILKFVVLNNWFETGKPRG